MLPYFFWLLLSAMAMELSFGAYYQSVRGGGSFWPSGVCYKLVEACACGSLFLGNIFLVMPSLAIVFFSNWFLMCLQFG